MNAAPIYPKRRPSRVSHASPQRNRKRANQPGPWVGVLSVLTMYTAVFCVFCSVTLGISSVIGHSMKENSRRDAIRSTQRAKSARIDVGRIRSRLERLTTMKAVDDWTRDNGFIASYQVPKQAMQPIDPVRPTLVARIDNGLQIEVLVARLESGDQAR